MGVETLITDVTRFSTFETKADDDAGVGVGAEV